MMVTRTLWQIDFKKAFVLIFILTILELLHGNGASQHRNHVTETSLKQIFTGKVQEDKDTGRRRRGDGTAHTNDLANISESDDNVTITLSRQLPVAQVAPLVCHAKRVGQRSRNNQPSRRTVVVHCFTNYLFPLCLSARRPRWSRGPPL